LATGHKASGMEGINCCRRCRPKANSAAISRLRALPIYRPHHEKRPSLCADINKAVGSGFFLPMQA